MKNCIIVGRIIPERANVRFGLVPFRFNHSQVTGSGTAFAEFSQVSVHLKLDKDCDNHYQITSIARSVTAPISNFIAFTQTAAYHIAFDIIIDADNQRHHSISVSEPLFSEEVQAPNTFFKKKEHEAVLVPNSVFNPILQRSLDDLANSLRYPQLSPMYCRLAIETLRTSFDPHSEPNAWRLLREALNVRRETIDSFWKLAADLRHGRIVEHSWDERKSCLRTAWEIVNRFVLRIEDPTIRFEPI
jgi:hypothetical protein